MTSKTKGIVFRTVKYGETSVITTIYTELFGLQSYLINGVRSGSTKGSTKWNLFQPPAVLDMVVYHNELRNLQRIKEYKWGVLYKTIFYDVVKNAIALYMIELAQKSIRQPEQNAELFHFIEDALLHLDASEKTVMANFPLYFSLHLMSFFGFRFSNNYSVSTPVLDLREGVFVSEEPAHPDFIDQDLSQYAAMLLQVMQPQELNQIRLNKETRRKLLYAFQAYYAYHLPEFGTLKSLSVLQTVLE